MGTTIKVRQHGSYLIEGDDVTVVDWNGRPYKVDRYPIALCRCGASQKKPFCDGSHKCAAPDVVAVGEADASTSDS